MATTYTDKKEAINELQVWIKTNVRVEERINGINEIIYFVQTWDIEKHINIKDIESWKQNTSFTNIDLVLSFLENWASCDEIELILQTFDTCTNHVILTNLEEKLAKYN